MVMGRSVGFVMPDRMGMNDQAVRFGVDVIEEGCTAVIPDKQEREQETFQYGDRSFHESKTHQEGLPDKSTKIK